MNKKFYELVKRINRYDSYFVTITQGGNTLDLSEHEIVKTTIIDLKQSKTVESIKRKEYIEDEFKISKHVKDNEIKWCQFRLIQNINLPKIRKTVK